MIEAPPPESPLSAFESAAVVSLRPGDVVLFRSPTRLSADGREHIVAMLDEVFPAHESIVLEGGQDIAVLRPEPGMFGRMWRRVFKRAEDDKSVFPAVRDAPLMPRIKQAKI